MGQCRFEQLSRLVQTARFFASPRQIFPNNPRYDYDIIAWHRWRRVAYPISLSRSRLRFVTFSACCKHTSMAFYKTWQWQNYPKCQFSRHAALCTNDSTPQQVHETSWRTQASVRKMWSAQGHSKRDILSVASAAGEESSELNLEPHEINLLSCFRTRKFWAVVQIQVFHNNEEAVPTY